MFIGKASPHRSCYIALLNASMRRELLDGEPFGPVLEAKVVIDEWLGLCNTRRPAAIIAARRHGDLIGRPGADEFAAVLPGRNLLDARAGAGARITGM